MRSSLRRSWNCFKATPTIKEEVVEEEVVVEEVEEVVEVVVSYFAMPKPMPWPPPVIMATGESVAAAPSEAMMDEREVVFTVDPSNKCMV